MVLPLSQEAVHMEKHLEVVWLWRANGSSVLDRQREIETVKKRKRVTRGSMLSKKAEIQRSGMYFFSANRAANVKVCGLDFAGTLIVLYSIDLQTIHDQSPKFKAQVR